MIFFGLGGHLLNARNTIFFGLGGHLLNAKNTIFFGSESEKVTQENAHVFALENELWTEILPERVTIDFQLSFALHLLLLRRCYIVPFYRHFSFWVGPSFRQCQY